MRKPKVGDILIRHEHVYDKWIVTQVFTGRLLEQLIEYSKGDVVFTIRPIEVQGVKLDFKTMNLKTEIHSMYKLRTELHTWEINEEVDEL